MPDPTRVTVGVSEVRDENEGRNGAGGSKAERTGGARASVTSAFIYSKHASYLGPAGVALAPPAKKPTMSQRVVAWLAGPVSVSRSTAAATPAEHRSADVDLEAGTAEPRRGSEARRESGGGAMAETGFRENPFTGNEVRVSQIGIAG